MSLLYGERCLARVWVLKWREGSCVRLWVGHWLPVGPLSLFFPRLFRVVVNKKAVVKECYAGEGGFV